MRPYREVELSQLLFELCVGYIRLIMNDEAFPGSLEYVVNIMEQNSQSFPRLCIKHQHPST